MKAKFVLINFPHRSDSRAAVEPIDRPHIHTSGHPSTDQEPDSEPDVFGFGDLGIDDVECAPPPRDAGDSSKTGGLGCLPIPRSPGPVPPSATLHTLASPGR